ncbi:activating signal cointegrator 1 complex subunit 2 [Forsythia ovata]|uniref:Activating signal cointegrator 1 complex subunit 2 n=1 Tax=Forsythia ovata TaxID=205694 RepID=A0ABD1WZI8_9LAMI
MRLVRVDCLKRLENCGKRLTEIFGNRKRHDAFWKLISQRKKELEKMNGNRGRLLPLVWKGRNDELIESTRPVPSEMISGIGDSDSLMDRVDLHRGKTSDADGGSSTSNAANSKWNSRKKPQFYVKDGKNYSYKVEGSVAAANYNEAALVNQAQKELIHGLGQGGNIPLGTVQRLTQSNEEQEDGADTNEVGGQGGRGNAGGRGRGGSCCLHTP